MAIPKVGLNINHIKWCHNFMKEQKRSAEMVRRVLKQNRMFNPFDKSKEVDNILKRYGRSFW